MRRYSDEDFSRFFMPGHQGGCEWLDESFFSRLDLTEIEGADNLFFPTGIIKSLEERVSDLFSCDCYISTNGSTSLVKTILWLFKERDFIVQRGSHFSVFNAAAIFSIEPIIIGDYETVSLFEIEEAILKAKRGCVLFLTSPNYYGEILDICKIKDICKKYDAILAVDCAHGAHLSFLRENKNPISLGADICCCSMHKTLPTLTGAAVLQIKKGLFEREEIKKTMALFLSSSPSYLIMDSIGLCVDWLFGCFSKPFLELEERKENLVGKLNLKFLKTEPCKLVLDCLYVKGGVFKALFVLKQFKIAVEFYNFRYICFILSPFLKEKDWNRLEDALKELEFVEVNEIIKTKFNFKRVCSLKKAIEKKKEKVLLKDSLSRIFADMLFYEIPGVLVLTYGEVITEEVILYLEKKRVREVLVLKKGEVVDEIFGE